MPDMICPKCGNPMSTGYLLDVGQAHKPLEWIEGMPEKSFWTGVKLKGRRRFNVVADRCERCGYLELYA
ncbi:MAG TPA: PF20097 family protein [Longimicrobium sp.]